MIVNKEGKLFGKINIIDILVVLALLVAAFGIYTRFFVSNEKVATASKHIEYTMKVEGVRRGTVDALQNYSPISNAATGAGVGEIINVTYTDATKNVEALNGSMRLSKLPERYDVYVTVRVDGNVNPSGYYTASNEAISAGSKYVFMSKYAKTTGTVTEIKEIQ